MLSATERAWLDGYHARVRRDVRPAVDDADQRWLDAATAALALRQEAASFPISFSHSSSVKTATPCFLASASFEPAPGPATT